MKKNAYKILPYYQTSVYFAEILYGEHFPLNPLLVISVMLQIALPLSTSLLAVLESLERINIMATAFWLLIMIIHMLNTIACVAVNEMVQLLFEYYRDIQSRGHFLPTNIKI